MLKLFPIFTIVCHVKIKILIFILLYHHASTFVVKNWDVAHTMAKYPICHTGGSACPLQLIFLNLIFLWVFLKNPVRRAMNGYTEQVLPGHPCVYSGLCWIHLYVKNKLKKISLLNWEKRPTRDHLVAAQWFYWANVSLQGAMATRSVVVTFLPRIGFPRQTSDPNFSSVHMFVVL